MDEWTVTMNLLGYLMNKSIQDLQSIAGRIGLSGFENSKQRLISKIIRNLTQSTGLTRIIADLSEDGLELLRYLVARKDDPPTLHELFTIAQEESHADLQNVIRELEWCCLLGVVDEKCVVFAEVHEPIRQRMTSLMTAPAGKVSAPKHCLVASNVWLDDLITVLGFLLRNDVRFTRLLQPSRKDLKPLEGLLRGIRLNEVHSSFLGFPLDWTERIFGFLSEHNLVTDQGGRISVTETALPQIVEWFRLNDTPSPGSDSLPGTPQAVCAPNKEEEDPGSLVRKLLELIQSRTRYIRFSYGYRAVVQSVLAATPGERDWHQVESLTEAIQPTVNLFKRAAAASQEMDSIRLALFDLFTLGCCDLGYTEQAWYWRPHYPNHTEGVSQFQGPEDVKNGGGIINGEGLELPLPSQIHLQPTFEILAPADFPAEARIVLEQISELITIDQLLHYRITRESVYGALCRGWSVERQLTWYSSKIREKRQIPQNVYQSIESWGTSYGRISLEEPLLLMCDTPDLAQEILHAKELSEYCLGLYGTNAVALQKGTADQVLQKLHQIGYLPHPDVGDGTRWIR
jgi:hypothetical protein